jgi:hypothetical protein
MDKELLAVSLRSHFSQQKKLPLSGRYLVLGFKSQAIKAIRSTIHD